MNRIVHFEFQTSDPAKSRQFFSSTFGWKFHSFEGPMEYWLTETGAKGEPGIDGGLMPSPDQQPRTVNTLQVDSVDDAARKVETAGGKVVVPKMAIPNVGWVAYCTDPTGLLFGIYTHDEAAR